MNADFEGPQWRAHLVLARACRDYDSASRVLGASLPFAHLRLGGARSRRSGHAGSGCGPCEGLTPMYEAAAALSEPEALA